MRLKRPSTAAPAAMSAVPAQADSRRKREFSFLLFLRISESSLRPPDADMIKREAAVMIKPGMKNTF